MPFGSIPNLVSSVASLSIYSFANTTSLFPGTITSSPTQITSALNISTSCSSCVLAVDMLGLQQIFWFSETWSVTLDTEYVTVTSFNGSNATALTNTRTVLGDILSLNTTVPYISSLMNTIANGECYFNSRAKVPLFAALTVASEQLLSPTDNPLSKLMQSIIDLCFPTTVRGIWASRETSRRLVNA